MAIDDFAGSVLAGAAAACHGQQGLHFAKRSRAALDDLADLTVADGSANTNVHMDHRLDESPIWAHRSTTE